MLATNGVTTPNVQVSSSQLSVGSSARRTIFHEPRGARRTEFVHNVDLRAEKVFNIQGHRFGVYADMTNLFNSNAVTAVQQRTPSSGGITFMAPTGIQGARQVTFGGRWSF